jgi:hypothetical protein
VRKLPTSTQLRATWHTDSLDMVVLPSTDASYYHKCCIDGGTSPEYFGYTLIKQRDSAHSNLKILVLFSCYFNHERSMSIKNKRSLNGRTPNLSLLLILNHILWLFPPITPCSSAGIGTGYGLDVPGIESPWGAKFSAHVQTVPGAHPASCKMGTESFPGVKRPGRDPSPPSSAEV